MRCAGATALLAVAVLALPLSAAAQRTTGEIIGTVVDGSGSVLPGVTVTLRGPGVAGAPVSVTTESGTYRFAVLPPGTYELDYVLSGFTTLKHTGVMVSVGAIVELNAALSVGGVSETITVASEAPVVTSSTSQVSTTYNREWVRNAPVKRFSYFDSDQLGARRQRDLERRPEHVGAVARQQHQRELLPDRRHRHQLDAVAEHRRDRGSRSPPARGVRRIRQRPGRRLQRRHAPGQQPVPRRRQRLLPVGQPDRPQHVGGGGPRLPLPPRQVARHHASGVRSVPARPFLVLRRAAVSARLGLAARRQSRLPGEERHPAGVLEVQLQHHAEPPAAARVPRRLLLHSGRRLGLHRAEHDRSEPRRQPDAEPGLHRRAVVEDDSRGEVLGLLAAQLQRSERDRPGAGAAALRGPGHRPDHRRHQQLGRESQLALRLFGEDVAHDRTAARRQPRLEGRRAIHHATAATTCRDRTTPT